MGARKGKRQMKPVDQPGFSPESIRAEEIYAKSLREHLEPALNGKFVAIDVLSGDYIVGDELLDAYDRGAAKYPGRTFIYKRIGYDVTHFIGAA